MSGDKSGRLAIIQGAAVDDQRLGASAFRVLAVLGTYSDREGWCWPKQSTLAERLGISQQAVSKSIKELEAFGYIEIEHRTNASGMRTSSRYRLVLDYTRADTERLPAPSQPQVVAPQPQVVSATTSGCDVTTSGCAIEEERTHLERPHLNESTPRTSGEVQGGGSGLDVKQVRANLEATPVGRVFLHYKAKIFHGIRSFDEPPIAARLKDWTEQELCQAIDNFAADYWWMENNATRGVKWFFTPQRIDQFLNLKPRSRDAVTRAGAGRAGQRTAGPARTGGDPAFAIPDYSSYSVRSDQPLDDPAEAF